MGDGTEQVQVTDLWCRRCDEPVRRDGSLLVPGHLRKAVHVATGREECADGEHVAAPIGAGVSP